MRFEYFGGAHTGAGSYQDMNALALALVGTTQVGPVGFYGSTDTTVFENTATSIAWSNDTTGYITRLVGSDMSHDTTGATPDTGSVERIEIWDPTDGRLIWSMTWEQSEGVPRTVDLDDVIYAFESSISALTNSGASSVLLSFLTDFSRVKVLDLSDRTEGVNLSNMPTFMLNRFTTIIGTDFDDLLYLENSVGGTSAVRGRAGNDFIVSGNHVNIRLYGDEGNDTLWGTIGSDSLYGGTGDDVLNGNTRLDLFVFDTAFFTGAFGEYDFDFFRVLPGASFTRMGFVVDHGSGADGRDSAYNVNRFQFGDGVQVAVVTDIYQSGLVTGLDVDLTLTDTENRYVWATQNRTLVDPLTGAAHYIGTWAITYDDGDIVTETFAADGALISTYFQDITDTKAWTTREITGPLDAPTKVDTLMDDGRTVTRTNHDTGGATIVNTDAGDAYHWATFTREVDATGSVTAAGRTFDDGRVRVDTFADGKLQGFTTLDTADAHSWASTVTTYADGVLVSRLRTLDDGGTSLRTVTGEGTATTVRKDALGVTLWTAQIVEERDAGGALERVTTTYSDGRSVVNTYDGSGLQSRSITDGGDLFAWSSWTETYSGGQPVNTLIVYDDTSTRETFYDGGVASRVVLTDLAGTETWHSIEKRLDGAGNMTEQLVVLDNGATRLKTFEAGVLASKVITDVLDLVIWQERGANYDASGNLTERTMTLDNGIEITWTYNAGGDVTTVFVEDVPDLHDWTHYTEVHFGTGYDPANLIERSWLLDNGRSDDDFPPPVIDPLSWA